jgi:hypothetical protein
MWKDVSFPFFYRFHAFCAQKNSKHLSPMASGKFTLSTSYKNSSTLYIVGFYSPSFDDSYFSLLLSLGSESFVFQFDIQKI